MKNKFDLYVILFLVVIFIGTTANSKSLIDKIYFQSQENFILSERQEQSSVFYIINFNTKKYKLSNEGEVIIDTLKKRYDRFETIYKGNYKYYKVLIEAISCKDETKYDPFIGVKRAKMIKDYMVKKHHFDEADIYIIDNTNSSVNINTCFKGYVKITGVVYQ